MCARRKRRASRPDSWILDDGPDIELLRAIAAGRVVRAEKDGRPGSTAIQADHVLDGVTVRMNVPSAPTTRPYSPSGTSGC